MMNTHMNEQNPNEDDYFFYQDYYDKSLIDIHFTFFAIRSKLIMNDE